MAHALALVPAGSSTPLRIIDRYQLVALIGKGGMAQVFHGRLQRIGGFERDVAVKLLLPEYSAEPEFVEMLLDEARIASAICHPCVVQMLDVGREGDQFYLVMEYVDGTDLRSVLRFTEGRVPEHMALHVVGEVLRGLHAVHTAVDAAGVCRRIVHRDVSPANVLLDRSGAVKLGDFGIARASGRLAKTRHGSIKGKLRYMAPEQLRPGAPEPTTSASASASNVPPIAVAAWAARDVRKRRPVTRARCSVATRPRLTPARSCAPSRGRSSGSGEWWPRTVCGRDSLGMGGGRRAAAIS